METLKRTLLASVLALVGTFVAYAALGATSAVAGGWSAQDAPSQALGLALYALVVFLRGLLPAVLLTSIFSALASRWSGRPPGAVATLGLAFVAASLVVPAILTPEIGHWPRLQVQRPVDAAATVLALAAAAAAAVALAGRIVRARSA